MSVRRQCQAVNTEEVREQEEQRRRRAVDAAEAFLAKAASSPGEERGRLLSHVVHEVRNPLAAAMWSVEMLARRPLGDPRQDRLANLAARSVRRLRSLLEDYFQLERMPEAGPPMRLELMEAVRRSLEPHDFESDSIPATITGPGEVFVEADPRLLDRLLHACVRRAFLAGEGGPVTIEVRPSTEHAGADVRVRREGLGALELDPGPLTPAGSEGAGTTFTMLIARLAAHRLQVPLRVEDEGSAGTIVLELPAEARH